MRRFLILPFLLIPLACHAADSTGYARSPLSCLPDDPTGCRPDYDLSPSYTFGTTFSEMGWVHVELLMPNAAAMGKSTMTLLNRDGTTAQTWTHEGRNLDTFQVWAPVHTGQRLVFSGTYQEIQRSVFHPCIKLQ